MKKIIEFVKKNRLYILSVLLVFFFLRSCTKSGQVRKLEKINTNNIEMIDSLTLMINNQKETIFNITEVIRVEKIKVHVEYDNWISEKNRGEQLMELHRVVKDNIKKLEK